MGDPFGGFAQQHPVIDGIQQNDGIVVLEGVGGGRLP